MAGGSVAHFAGGCQVVENCARYGGEDEKIEWLPVSCRDINVEVILSSRLIDC